ncbi:MAG TPA: hypothetical protein PLN61_08350 [bacterium]|nr:hypothetical protein [bacterium]HQI48664.1 hypothetical protein [bacterium]HQJ64683.1 hypothetical protein [bacterium]
MTVLLLLALALAFILADYLVQLRQAKSFAPATTAVRRPVFHSIEELLPRGVFAASGQLWSSLLPNGEIRLGVSRLMLSALHSIDAVSLPQPGQRVKKGEPILSLQLGKRTLTLRAPMAGTVTTINRALKEDPQGLYHDINRAWALALQPDNLSESVKGMRIGEEAYQWLRSEMARLRDFIALAVPQQALAPAMQDGGLPAQGALQALDDANWSKFVEEFLDRPTQN